MEQSPSGDTNRSSASEEILFIVWNLNVPYYVHKSLPPVFIVNQINLPSPCSLSHFLNIHFKIILPSTRRSSKWSLSFRFPYQNPACTSPLPFMCRIPHPSHSSWFYHPNNIWGGVQVMKLRVFQSSTCLCFLVWLLLQVRTFTV